MHNELDAIKVRMCTPKVPSRQLLLSFAIDEYSNYFPCRDLPHHLAINPADGVQFVRPVGWIMRPCEPGGFVLFPFGWHRETKFGRSCICARMLFHHRIRAKIVSPALLSNLQSRVTHHVSRFTHYAST